MVLVDGLVRLKSFGTARPRHALLLICVLAIVPRVYVALNEPLGYDEYWHLFIAQQDTRQALALEWRSNAHPPLYYWLLRLPMSLGRGLLLDRSLSLAAGVVTVFVVGRIVLMLTAHSGVSLLAALAFAMAPSAVLLSAEIRSYMLCTCLVVVAFSQYVSLLQGRGSIRAAIVFSLAASSALMSHYFAAFFLLACLGALLYTIALRIADRTRQSYWEHSWTLLALGSLPIAATAAFLYRTHVRAWLHSQTPASSFYYHPESGDMLLEHVVRGSHNTFNRFSPITIEDTGAIPVALLAAAFIGVSLLYFARVRRRSTDMPRGLPLLFLLLIGGGMLIASVKGAYPFGGDLRHQFLLFPFIVISAFVALDSMVSRWRRLAVPVAGLLVVGMCANSVVQLRQFLVRESGRLSIDMFARQMDLYRQTFPEPGAVYLGQFSLVVFFAHHDRWRWRSIDLNTYEVTNGALRILVLRDRSRPSLDLGDERLYQDVAERLRALHLEATTMFSLRHPVPYGPWSPDGHEALRRQVRSRASQWQLEARRLFLDGFLTYGEFGVQRY